MISFRGVPQRRLPASCSGPRLNGGCTCCTTVNALSQAGSKLFDLAERYNARRAVGTVSCQRALVATGASRFVVESAATMHTPAMAKQPMVYQRFPIGSPSVVTPLKEVKCFGSAVAHN